jgi:septation ring formation regulator EzrA
MMTEEKKWNVERIHKEINDARTTMFVVTKVLETGSVDFSEHPEWVLVIRPLLRDLMKNADHISELLGIEGEAKEEPKEPPDSEGPD